MAVHFPGPTAGLPVAVKSSWHRSLLAPLHALAVVTKAKSFRDNVVIGNPTLNRWGLHIARRRLAHRLGLMRRARLRGLISAADRAAFERDGFLIKPDFLDPETFRAVREEVMSLRGQAREFASGDTLTRLIPLDGANLHELPAVRSVIEGGTYRGLLDYVGSFRRRPNVFVQTVFSGIGDAARDEQTFFHCDTFHPTVKSWLYLEDVTERSLPFVYVPASHRLTRRRLAWERRASITAGRSADLRSAQGSLRISEREIRRLGYGPPRALPVPANTLVVADTSGFHARGGSSLQTRRVAIYGFKRSSPFLPWVGGDPAALLGLKRLAVRAYWRVIRPRDSPQPVGERSAISPPAARAARGTGNEPQP
jgi:hypothetical protein